MTRYPFLQVYGSRYKSISSGGIAELDHAAAFWRDELNSHGFDVSDPSIREFLAAVHGLMAQTGYMILETRPDDAEIIDMIIGAMGLVILNLMPTSERQPFLGV